MCIISPQTVQNFKVFDRIKKDCLINSNLLNYKLEYLFSICTRLRQKLDLQADTDK